MTAILKGPKCHTATEDSTQEHPALPLQDPPFAVTGLAVAEVRDIGRVEVVVRLLAPSTLMSSWQFASSFL